MSVEERTLGATVLRGDALNDAGIYELPPEPPSVGRFPADASDFRPVGRVVVALGVGEAQGSRAAAAALACAGSDPERAALLIERAPSRRPRPTLLATAAARELEERIALHLPAAAVAARGAICALGLATGEDEWLATLRAALALAREGAAVVHLAPEELQPLLADSAIAPSGALLRADLPAERALTALVANDLIGRGVRVAVLERRLSWPSERAALFGALPKRGLPPRLRARLLGVGVGGMKGGEE